MSVTDKALAASSASFEVPASAPASSPLVFRSDAADVGFPWAGAALLLLLVVLAVAVRWQAVRSGGAPTWLRRWMSPGTAGANTSPAAALLLQSSVRLDAQTQLHVVQWEGRKLLVATSPNAAPVLLDRATPADAATEGQP